MVLNSSEFNLKYCAATLQPPSEFCRLRVLMTHWCDLYLDCTVLVPEWVLYKSQNSSL